MASLLWNPAKASMYSPKIRCVLPVALPEQSLSHSLHATNTWPTAFYFTCVGLSWLDWTWVPTRSLFPARAPSSVKGIPSKWDLRVPCFWFKTLACSPSFPSEWIQLLAGSWFFTVWVHPISPSLPWALLRHVTHTPSSLNTSSLSQSLCL